MLLRVQEKHTPMFKILEIDTYTAERNRNGQTVHLSIPYVVVYRFAQRSVESGIQKSA